MLSINRVTSDAGAVISQIGRLRVRSWADSGAVAGFLPESDCWLDEHDQHAALWTASVDGTIVASARLCVHERTDELPDAAYFRGFETHFPGPVALLSRLVVAPEARGLGLP